MTKKPHSPDDWLAELNRLADKANEEVSAASAPAAIEDVRVRYLGRQGGLFSELFKALKDFSLDDRKRVGPKANELKDRITAAVADKLAALEAASSQKAPPDPTLPASRLGGRVHPLTETIEEMARILSQLGFSRADGPLVETEHYNFEALNIPADHPARDMQDTFYLAGGGLLRTHTSPVQIRYMESHKPPIRVMAPGRVFRHEAVDASHSAVFHQVEGLYVDRGVTMADLKGTLQTFMKKLLGPATKTRFRPSYFPFTEPSAEVDVLCLFCSGAGCGVCKRSGWLEMLGSGLVNPKVLRGVGLDPEEFSGFAFGIGVERIAMLRLGIPDIRMFYENDARFLEQFG